MRKLHNNRWNYGSDKKKLKIKFISIEKKTTIKTCFIIGYIIILMKILIYFFSLFRKNAAWRCV